MRYKTVVLIFFSENPRKYNCMNHIKKGGQND
jgi:hypothetical protein